MFLNSISEYIDEDMQAWIGLRNGIIVSSIFCLLVYCMFGIVGI